MLLLISEKVAEIHIFRKFRKATQNERYISLREHAPNSAIDIEPLPPEPYPFIKSDTLHTTLRTDRDGFIISKNNSESPDIKLFFLGGSTTECLYNDENKRFPELTARILEKKFNKRINAYNCGTGGTNSLHSLNILMNKVIPKHADYAFLMHNINDLVTLCYLGSYWTENNARSAINNYGYYYADFFPQEENKELFPNLRFLFKKDNIRVQDQFKGLRKKLSSNQIDSAKIIIKFKQNLELFVAICKIYNIIPVLMTQANNFDILDYNWFEKNNKINFDELGSGKKVFFEKFVCMLKSFNIAIKEVAQESNCDLIDLDSAITETKYFEDEVHYNNAGCVKVANCISDIMLPIIQYNNMK